MKVKVAFPLLAITAIIAGIIGIASGLVFLVVFAVAGLAAAVIGGIMSGRKLHRN